MCYQLQALYSVSGKISRLWSALIWEIKILWSAETLKRSDQTKIPENVRELTFPHSDLRKQIRMARICLKNPPVLHVYTKSKWEINVLQGFLHCFPVTSTKPLLNDLIQWLHVLFCNPSFKSHSPSLDSIGITLLQWQSRECAHHEMPPWISGRPSVCKAASSLPCHSQPFSMLCCCDILFDERSYTCAYRTAL